MQPVHHVLLLENPHSGGGNPDTWQAEPFMRVVQERGIRLSHLKPENPEQSARALLEEKDAQIVAIAGGDGTLSGMLPAILKRDLPLLVLPAGTANDFARSLAMPKTPEALAALLWEGRVTSVDVGYANDTPFLNAASIGLTNSISRLQTEGRKSRWGILSYALSAFEAGRISRPFHARLTGTGRERRLRCVQLLVGNGRYYGGGMTVHDEASLVDGMLHLHAIKPRSLFGLAALLPFLRTGHVRLAPEVFCEDGIEMIIATEPPHHVFADGEEITRTPVRFHIKPRSLRVLVPEEEDA